MDQCMCQLIKFKSNAPMGLVKSTSEFLRDIFDAARCRAAPGFSTNRAQKSWKPIF